MIEVCGICGTYQADSETVEALADVSFRVRTGSVCVLIGPSGGGKSTLLRMMAGIQMPKSGSVLIDGKPVHPKTQVIGFVPQTYGLLPWRTVRENVCLGHRIKQPHAPMDEKKLQALLQKLGLSALEDRFPSALSGGQQQRAGLARAFFLQPELLLMDEPFSALDALTREEMQRVLLQLWTDTRMTAVLVTHDTEEAVLLGHQIVVLTGRPGRVRTVLENPFFGQYDARETVPFLAMRRQLRALIEAGEA